MPLTCARHEYSSSHSTPPLYLLHFSLIQHSLNILLSKIWFVSTKTHFMLFWNTKGGGSRRRERSRDGGWLNLTDMISPLLLVQYSLSAGSLNSAPILVSGLSEYVTPGMPRTQLTLISQDMLGILGNHDSCGFLHAPMESVFSLIINCPWSINLYDFKVGLARKEIIPVTKLYAAPFLPLLLLLGPRSLSHSVKVRQPTFPSFLTFFL